LSKGQLGFARKVWGIIRTFNNTEAYQDWLTSTGIDKATANKATKRMQTVFDIRSKYDWSGRQNQE
jgi:hypothetical protein